MTEILSRLPGVTPELSTVKTLSRTPTIRSHMSEDNDEEFDSATAIVSGEESRCEMTFALLYLFKWLGSSPFNFDGKFFLGWYKKFIV